MLGRTSRRRTSDHDAVRERLALLGAVPQPPAGRDPPEAATVASGPGRHAARPIGSLARLRAAVSDRLPARMRHAMDEGFTGHHLGVLAVVLAVGLALTAWWVLSGRPEQRSVPPASFGASAEPPSQSSADLATDSTPGASATPSGGTAPAATESGEVIIVDVAGKVRRPGIVTLPPGSRVVDALEAAGGARRGVDLADLNLARVLVDGEQLLVGVDPVSTWAPTGPSGVPSSTATVGIVNINTADQPMLETLPGIGPVTAQAILEWRAANGAFTSVDELLEVDGIGDATLSDIRDLVTV